MGCSPSSIQENSNQEAQHSEKFAKGSDKDLSNGPVKRRRCTDVPWLLIFLISVGFYVYCSFIGVSDGNLYKLLKPRDYAGDYCSIADQWNNGTDLEGYDYMIYTLNVTEAFNAMAEAFLCSPSMRDKLIMAAVVTEREWNSACIRPDGDDSAAVPCGSLDECQAAARAKFEKYFDVSQVAGLLSGSSANTVLSQLTKYFNRVCVTSCSIDLASANGTDARTVVYAPPPEQPWAGAWNRMVSAAVSLNVSTEFFSLKALPYSECPYDAEFCVPLPGLTFREFYHGYCTIDVDDDVLEGVTESFGAALGGVAKDAVGKLSAGLDAAFGDIQNTIDVFIITAVLALILGVAFLVLLRFFVRPVIWLSIVLVFFAFAIGGYLLYYYSQMCEDSKILDAATREGFVTLQNSTCGGMYHLKDETARDVMEYSGYVAWGLAVLWFFTILCLCKRIRLAIAINQVAAMFVYQTPHIVLVPAIQYIFAIGWSAGWMFLAAFLVSQVPADFVPTGSYATYAEAYGTEDKPGACTSSYPTGSVFYDPSSSECSGAAPKCWSCAPPRYVLDYRFWFSLLMFFWNNAFLVAVGQCTIAGACGIWFFNRNRDGSRKASVSSVCTAAKNCLVFHMGSLAFGSLILAVVQTLKWFMQYLSKQAKAQKNKVMECIAKACVCCLWCFEKCIKFLNKNAYIQVALMGTSFCSSARSAFFLILRNAARFGVLVGLGAVTHFIGKFFILVSTGVIGFLILESMHPEIEAPYLLVVMYCVIGYFSGSLFMNVFGLAVDTTLQCFIATEEMQIPNDFIPQKLRGFVQDNQGDEQSGCFSCSCCF